MKLTPLIKKYLIIDLFLLVITLISIGIAAVTGINWFYIPMLLSSLGFVVLSHKQFKDAMREEDDRND